jgi:hypothetical protein
MSLAQRIHEAKALGVWLHERTNEMKLQGGLKEQTGLAILQLAYDIADAIVVLIEARLPGPAMSLSRPLFEGYVRGFWLLECATEKQIDRFLKGKCPNFRSLLASIPKDAESGGAWIHANSEKNLVALHDLTHGGSVHVKRRINEGSVEPRYPEEELRSLVNLGNEIRVRIGAELLTRLNDEEGLKNLSERAKTLRMER